MLGVGFVGLGSLPVMMVGSLVESGFGVVMDVGSGSWWERL